MANTQVFVVDSQMNVGSPGEVGELCVASLHLARGYLNRAELTTERFVDNPMPTDSTGTRVFRTGDLARVHPDGQIELVGRADLQVKIRGFRVELEEIEAVLAMHEKVQQTAVVTQPFEGDKRLIAYIVLRTGEMLVLRELRTFLESRLPDYMIPAIFVRLDSMPLTSTGKVDRQGLPMPQKTRPQLDTPYEEPRNAIEAAIAESWTELLQLDQVGIHDHFLELGGDSLFATTAAARIADYFAVDCAPITFFENPTVAALSTYISSRLAGPPRTSS
jgi:hypothetical protein